MWLFTYKASVDVRYIDVDGREFHPAARASVQPGWVPPAVVIVVLIGTVLALRLVPARPRLVRSLAGYFARGAR